MRDYSLTERHLKMSIRQTYNAPILHEFSDKHIDERQRAHYYSPMNLKATKRSFFTLSLLVFLSACSSHKKVTKIETPPDANTKQQHEAEANVSDDLTLQTSALPSGEPTPEVSPTKADVLARIRQGFEFPELKSKHTTQYEKWAAGHHSYLDNLFARGTPFLHYIVEEIEKRGLPMELALLPAVESAYKPTALSRSNAGGLWQFIPSTGRSFGLRQDWWYDGRNDPIESTQAALDYLTQLHKLFDGDWFLALAAYNAGQGTVSRAIKANKAKRRPTSYQDLALRLETQRYIPKLVALKNIIQNPQKFKVELPIIESEPYFKTIQLNGQIDLNKFARDSGIDITELRTLNAGFKRWATSPDGPHRLLIPVSNNNDTRLSKALLAAKHAPKINFENHTIARGDSLSSIAKRYGVSVSALKKNNNLRNSNIRAGKNLLIPIESNSRSTTASANSTAKNSLKQNKSAVHRVKKGDTLWSIARQYKVQVANLLNWNNLSKNQVLQPNQALLIGAN